MMNRFMTQTRWSVLACLFVLGLISAVIVLPYKFNAQAAGQKGLFVRTETADPALPNFDIREETKETVGAVAAFRQRTGTNDAVVNDIRSGFAQGENSLRSRVPTLKVEYNSDIKIPEVIGPDMMSSRAFLTGPSGKPGEKRSGILLNFLKENNSLIGANDTQIDGLKIAADYTNPDGNLSFVELDQEINGIPVFRGEVKAGFTHDGRMIRVINNFAPGLDYSSLSTDFRDPISALKVASSNINFPIKDTETVPNSAVSTDLKIRFGDGGDFAPTAEKMYFPTEPGVAVAAWRILIWEPVSAYYVIVDAESGTVLWRKNISNDQTQAATYNVYTDSTNLGGAKSSPAPSLGPLDPTTNFQAALSTRSNVTLIGNESAQGLSFNNNGWITDGTNGTDGNTSGNAVIAGLDIDGVNGVDAPQNGAGRVFNFAYTPGNVTGGVDGGDANNGSAIRGGAVTQLFYFDNRYHDALYKIGFTEAARNFQLSNFGRGGAENDRVSGEAQDSSGTNNANFATPADGTSGRMQMYLFTGPTPGRDGDFDGDVVFHEHTHGVSNRLIGNGSGLTSNRSSGSGEGWSDLVAFLLLHKPTDAINSVYSTGSYVTYRCCGLSSFTTNYYHGIRRFPYAIKSFTGGPNNLPHNPLTLADLNTVTASDGAYPCSTLIACTGSPTEVHNEGEIWAIAGIEVWAKFVTRLGNAAGTLKTLQTYVDGMKLSPLNPTYIQSRDSVIAAAAASSFAPDASVDVADVREGFRIRGMGFSATDNGTTVVEAFDTPNVSVTDPFAVSDSTGNNNGVPEPGENVLLSIPVINPSTGAAITNVQVNVNGGPNVSYGTINDNATVTHQIPFSIPAVACGSTQTVTINVTSSAGAQIPVTRSFALGLPAGIVQNFDGVVVPALPSGWTTTQDNSTTGITWATTASGPNSAPNSAFAGDPAAVNISSLVTPPIAITSAAAQVKFKNKYITESTFDGMVLEVTTNAGGTWTDIVTAGGSFVSGGYNATISSNFSSPIAGRQAWSGTSAGGYIDTVINLPASMNGQTIQLRWRMASDTSVSSTGVNVDDVQVVSSYTCAALNIKSRADFDGDGKTDVSVFRPSD
ncbi:MAG: M36 family metallopeptidase, partial [Acidobacteriota bacterium]